MKLNKNMIKKNLQQGFTIVEMILVLLIVGVLSVASLKGYAVYKESMASSEVGDLTFLISKLQAKYSKAAVTTGVTTANAITGNVFPESMNVGATTVTNRANGAVTVAAGTIATAGDAFVVTEAGWDSAQCQYIASNITPNVKRVTVTPSGGAATTIYSTYGTVVALTPSVTDAACSSDDSNLITLTFNKG